MLAALAFLAMPAALPAAELQILLPLGRTAYQTNEWIDVSVVRSSPAALPAGSLVLGVLGEDGSKLSFTFAAAAVPVEGKDARATEHLHLDGWLLRPGRYTLEAAADGATAKSSIEVFSHLRRSSFRLINWARAKGADQLAEGEDGLGFNLIYGSYARDEEANFLRAGCDFISCCTMGGGHQMDLRSECDWSDPYVTRGGARRAVARAMYDRTRPNVPGVHFYDEPGLSWFKHPVTGQMTPHGLPSQVRAYQGAFGEPPIPYYQVKADKADDAARWRHWALWKLGFMDAAWKEAQFGVSYVRPDYLSLTQTQYGFSAFSDGYYFNAARSLPIVSGHGGYDDYGGSYFNPSYFLEIARARDLLKPCWYLPTWYGNTPAERFRLEQYLSFMTNIQGMISPPDIDPFQPASSPAAEGVVESNKLMARLGTIFTTMPVTRPPVAMLYSMSENIHVQTGNMKANYAHDNKQGQHLLFTYLAGKILQQQFLPVVEEDIADGTLAAHHRAIVVTSVDYLDPPVVASLEQFAASGGLVLLTADCGVKIRGAINLGVTPELPEAATFKRLQAEGKYAESNKYATVGKLEEGARPLARAIKTQLDKARTHHAPRDDGRHAERDEYNNAGIQPPFTSDQPGIAATRQAAGDIEYLFAVNTTDDPRGGWNAIRAATATLAFAADGRPLYDAVRGGPAPDLEVRDGTLSGRFRFGPGQMRVFARTARPIGKVQALSPVVLSDYTRAELPRSVEVGAALLDAAGRVLAGSAPLRARLVDPLGQTRYDLYRATTDGSLRLSLPLAANDPAGTWKLVVDELLANHSDTATFVLEAVTQCGALAGATERAVSFGNERDNVFRFFRVHHDVTIAVGAGDYHRPAAQRLAESLRPWGVRCKIIAAAEVNRPRTISAEEAGTWVGLDFGRAKPGKENTPGMAGFDIEGPVVLLGTPEDNPLIQFLQKERFLSYSPGPQFPGRGRGLIAWQRDGIGAGQESVTLVAYDARGMTEAVGTVYEFASGMEPLTRLVLPQSNTIVPASQAKTAAEASPVWQVVLADRALALQSAGGKLRVLTWDGSLSELDASGKLLDQKFVPEDQVEKTAKQLGPPADAAAVQAARKKAPPGRIVKLVAVGGGLTAVGYWGGTLQVFDADGRLRTSQLLPQDLTAVAWLNGKLVAGLADGRVVALAVP
jgi:hypothetical protein